MPKSVQPPELITSDEAAIILRVHRATVIRRAQAGKIPTYHQNPGRTGARLFERSVIEALAATSQDPAA
jgi:hypothetical protein